MGDMYWWFVLKKRRCLHLPPLGGLIIGDGRVEHDNPRNGQMGLLPLVGLLQSTAAKPRKIRFKKRWMRLFLICRRRRQIKSAPNLTILFPRPSRRRFESMQTFCCFTYDGGSLALRVPPKVNFYTREVVECKKMGFSRKIYRRWGSKGHEGK